MENTHDPPHPGVRRRRRGGGIGSSVTARAASAIVAAIVAALIASPAPAAGADEPVRIAAADPVLDRNGDGFQDVIPAGRAVHHDIDFDGRFDYTLSLAFKEYSPEGHRQYLASGFAPDVFAELTRKGLANLCASERVAANWTAQHFREFLYYHDGYGRLQIFDGSPENDGRLAGNRAAPLHARGRLQPRRLGGHGSARREHGRARDIRLRDEHLLGNTPLAAAHRPPRGPGGHSERARQALRRRPHRGGRTDGDRLERRARPLRRDEPGRAARGSGPARRRLRPLAQRILEGEALARGITAAQIEARRSAEAPPSWRTHRAAGADHLIRRAKPRQGAGEHPARARIPALSRELDPKPFHASGHRVGRWGLMVAGRQAADAARLLESTMPPPAEEGRRRVRRGCCSGGR